MSDRRKVSVILLGGEGELKRDIVIKIFGGSCQQRHGGPEMQLYESDTCEVMCPLNDRLVYDIIKRSLSQRGCDMCLLVLEDVGVSTDTVYHQIEELHVKTGIPRHVFRLVHPQRSTHRTPAPSVAPFKVCTTEEVYSEVSRLVQDLHLLLTNKRHVEQPAPCSDSRLQRTGGRSCKEPEIRGSRVNLVLLGMSGTGKSSSGNTILGKTHFLSRPSSKPVTTECQVGETEIDGVRVRVVDTPDIFDDELSQSHIRGHVQRCQLLCQTQPCVYLLVIQVGRFTDGERGVHKKLEKAFGDNRIMERTIILFTCSEELQRAGMTARDFLHSCEPHLREVVETCAYRCVFFDNTNPSSVRVRELMSSVRKIL